MPRQPTPWYWEQRRVWCVQVRGKRIQLGPDKEKAYRKFHRLLAELPDVGIGPKSTGPTVREMFGQFLRWCKSERSARTHRGYSYDLEAFAETIPRNLPADELRPFHLTSWLTGTTWGTTYKHDRIQVVQRAYNWAKSEGLISASPLAGMVKPHRISRVNIYSPEERIAILAAAPPALRELLTVMAETGCRPEEARIVEARWCDLKAGVWVIPRERAKGHREPRTVVLTELSKALTAGAIARNPTGPIFRAVKGKPWTANALIMAMLRLKRELKAAGTPIPHATAYVFRHTWITDALAKGVDIGTVAQLAGHRDTTMVSRVYAHLLKRMDYLREQAQRAVA